MLIPKPTISNEKLYFNITFDKINNAFSLYTPIHYVLWQNYDGYLLYSGQSMLTPEYIKDFKFSKNDQNQLVLSFNYPQQTRETLERGPYKLCGKIDLIAKLN